MAGSSYLGLAEVLSMMLIRRRFLISLASVLCVIFISFLLLVRPVYRGEVLIELVTPEQHGIGDEPGSLATALNESVVVATEADKVGSETVARNVYQAHKSEITADFDRAGWQWDLLKNVGSNVKAILCSPDRSVHLLAGPLCGPVDARKAEELLFIKFRKGVSVEALHGTRLVQVAYSASDAALTATIVNAFADEYMRENTEIANGRNDRFNGWIKSRLTVLRAQAQLADEAVTQYRNSTDLFEMGKDVDSARRSPAIEQLSALLQQLGNAKAERAKAEAKLNQIRAAQINPELAASLPDIVNSPVLSDLTRQSIAISGHLATLIDSYGPGHPIVQRARTELDTLQSAKKLQVALVLKAAATRYQNIVADVARLNQEVADAERLAVGELTNRVRLRELERTAKSSADVYDSFLKIATTSAATSSWQASSVGLVTKATTPVQPVFPNKQLMLPLSVATSLFLSAFVTTVIEIRRQRRVFINPEDMERLTGIGFVGSVPETRQLIEAPNNDLGYTMAIEDLALRLRGTSWINSKASYVVAVLSAVPGEGKSVLSLSLAQWCAGYNQRVLLIDADLRRPSHFDAEPCDDQEHVLGWTHDRPLRFSANTGVYYLSLAEIGRPTLAILAELPSIIGHLQKHFNVILIDTPPILAISDALSIIGLCNQILFAVQWGVTPKHALISALNRVSEPDRQRVQIVFTRVNTKCASLYNAPGLEHTQIRPYYLALSNAKQ